MQADTALDYAVFQLTPTRTLFELYVCAGNLTEKLASGLLQPFRSQLRVAEEQFAQGYYSIRLEPPSGGSDGNAKKLAWFSKGTMDRVVRFVSTPEVLERVSVVEAELLQLEDSLNIQLTKASRAEHQSRRTGSTTLLPGTKFADGLEHNKSACDSLASGSIEVGESSKFKLVRAMETRQFMLQKEQGMAFARALAAGFSVEHIPDLILFANCFGAVRLQEACWKFIALCTKRQEIGSGLEEVEYSATEAASSRSDRNGIMLANLARNKGDFAYVANAAGASDSWSEVPSERAAECQLPGNKTQFLLSDSPGQHFFYGQVSNHVQDNSSEGRGSTDWEQAENAYTAKPQVQSHPANAFWRGQPNISNMHGPRSLAYELIPNNGMLQSLQNSHIPFSSTEDCSEVQLQRPKAFSTLPQGSYMQVLDGSGAFLGDDVIEHQLNFQAEKHHDVHFFSSVTYPLRDEKSDGYPTHNIFSELDSSSATGSIANTRSDAFAKRGSFQRSPSPRRRSSSPSKVGRPNVKRSGMVLIKNINYIAPDVLDSSSTTKSRSKDKGVQESESIEMQKAHIENILAKQVENVSISVQDAIKLFECKEKLSERHFGRKSKVRSFTENVELCVSENMDCSSFNDPGDKKKAFDRQQVVKNMDARKEIGLYFEEKVVCQNPLGTCNITSFFKDPTMENDIILPERDAQIVSEEVPEPKLNKSISQQFTGNTSYSTTDESSALAGCGTPDFNGRLRLFSDPDFEQNDQRHVQTLQSNILEDDSMMVRERVRSGYCGNGGSSGFESESGVVRGGTFRQKDSFIIPERRGELAPYYPWNQTKNPDMEQIELGEDTSPTVEMSQELVIDESFMVPARATRTSLLQASKRTIVDAEFEHQEKILNSVEKLKGHILKDAEAVAISASDDLLVIHQRKSGCEPLPRSWTDLVDYDVQMLNAANEKDQIKDEHQLVDGKSTSLVGHMKKIHLKKGDGSLPGQQVLNRTERQARLKEMQDVLEKRKAEMTVKCAKLSDKPNPLFEAQLRAKNLRAFKANLAKEKEEKEQQERKRLEKLRLDRRDKLAARQSPSSLSTQTSSTVQRSSLPLPVAKRILESAAPLRTSLHGLSSSYEFTVKIPQCNGISSNQLHHPTMAKQKNTRDSISSQSVPSLRDYPKENKTKQTEPTQRKDVATLRELRFLPSSLKESQVPGPLRISKALISEPHAQMTVEKNYPVAKVRQKAKPFLRKGGGTGPGNGILARKQQNLVLSDSPKSQDGNHILSAKNVLEQDRKVLEISLVEEGRISKMIASEDRAGVGPGLTLIHAPATASDLSNFLSIENVESKEEEQQELTASVEDNFTSEAHVVDRTSLQSSHSRNHEDCSPPPVPTKLWVANSESSQKILPSLWEASFSQDPKDKIYNAPVATLSCSPRARNYASPPHDLAARCPEKLVSNRPEAEQSDSPTGIPLCSNLSLASSDAQYSLSHKLTVVQAFKEDNGTRSTDGRLLQPAKESAKGIRRFLKLGRKSHSFEYKTQSSASACVISEGDEDGYEANNIWSKFPDKWGRKIIPNGKGAKTRALLEGKDEFLQKMELNQNANSVSASGFFFLLSAFRRSSNPKTQS